MLKEAETDIMKYKLKIEALKDDVIRKEIEKGKMEEKLKEI